jgi:hypothetical protein
MDAQQSFINSAVLWGIYGASQPHSCEVSLILPHCPTDRDPYGSDIDPGPVDRASWEHLVSFLDNHRIGPQGVSTITEFLLEGIQLPERSDGGLDVLRRFFARSDTTLTKVTLWDCNFGNTEEASQLLEAFHTNRTVTDFTIAGIKNLEGIAVGTSLCGLLQNMPQLHRLRYSSSLTVEGVRALQPGLRNNHTLKQLGLRCAIGDAGIRLVADALVGNTTMLELDISSNRITCIGLDDITRLVESTRLQTINFEYNNVFDGVDGFMRLAAKVIKNTTIEQLQGIPKYAGGMPHIIDLINTIQTIYPRNKCLNHVDLLLAPLSLPQHQPSPTGSSTATNAAAAAATARIWMKTCPMAIAKFAKVPKNAGATAIFKLFQARPALLEKRVKRASAANEP